jgi:hypothetical protein
LLFSFVEMGSEAEAREAIEGSDGQEADGRPLAVCEARTKAGAGGWI